MAVMNKQRKDFEAYILEIKVPELIAKCDGQLTVEAARNIIEATWLPHHPEDGEFKAQATLDLFEMWKRAQACVEVELPVLPAGDEVPQNAQEWGWELLGKCRAAIEAAGGTVKK